MFIITDSKSYAEKLFAFSPDWQPAKQNIFGPALNKLTHQLFATINLFSAEIESGPIWNYCFIAEHSNGSQYKILIDAARETGNLPSGILCLAGSGDNFTGQRNRNWISLPGNIHLSAYLKPGQTVDHFHVGFTILSAISVVQTLDNIPALKTKAAIKWVNDIFLGDGKVSGVIAQTQSKGDLISDLFIGIGLNVRTAPTLENDFVNRKATSIKDQIKNKSQSRQAPILKNLLHALSTNYAHLLKAGYKTLFDFYKERSKIIGKNIAVYSDPLQGEVKKIKEGKVIAIGDDLELYLEGETKPIDQGRIFFI